MREVCRWWRARSSQFLVLCSFALLLAWQNLEVHRGEGFFRRIVAEVRESFRQQEVKREIQFARLLKAIEDRMSRIDEAIAAAHSRPDAPPSPDGPAESSPSKPLVPR